MSYKWKFKDVLTLSPTSSNYITIRSNGKVFSIINITASQLLYDQFIVYEASSGWTNEAYKTIEIDDYPAGDLLQFLQSNAILLPASNVNKVDLNGVTVLDLTSDTVTPETLLVGTTAHNAKGEIITGTLVPCTVYSAESPALDGTTSNSDTTFTWDIPSTEHGFNSKNLIVSVYLSTGEQIQCDVTISDTFTVTLTAVYNSEIVTRAGGGVYVSIPAGYLRAVIIGPVETPAAAQQAMLNQLPVYTGGGNYSWQ